MKLPRTPGPLTIDEADLAGWPGRMVRIHGTAGQHSLPWSELRHFGPTRTRFDPHSPPPAHHPDFAAQYVAADLETALAEVFQATRRVEPAAPNRPHLTVWEPNRGLRLLDLTGMWPVRNGASHVINTGPHAACRQWAHAAAIHPIRVDGLRYSSSMTGRHVAVLFLPAADSFPDRPLMTLPLTHPGLVGPIADASYRVGYWSF